MGQQVSVTETMLPLGFSVLFYFFPARSMIHEHMQLIPSYQLVIMEMSCIFELELTQRMIIQ